MRVLENIVFYFVQDLDFVFSFCENFKNNKVSLFSIIYQAISVSIFALTLKVALSDRMT